MITCLTFYHAIDDNLDNLYHNIGVILVTSGHINIFDAYVDFHDMGSPYHEAFFNLHYAVVEAAKIISQRGSGEGGTLDELEKESVSIYFYEYFLECYDKQARQDLGVWYTPESIVKFINITVGFLLKKHFPDKGVTYLDFATGTGTFMLDKIKREYKVMKTQLDKRALKWHLFNLVTGCELNDMSYIICVYNLMKLIYTLTDDWTGELPIIDPDRPVFLQVYNDNTLVSEGAPPLLSNIAKQGVASQKTNIIE